MAFTAKDVQALREKTGCGMMDCKKALTECNGDMDAATDYLREKAKDALTKIPIFVSEWGVSDASGNGGVYLEETRKWIDFMNENNISWINTTISHS